jgi:RNA polymerase sigma-70 factor (ECF subfamily)
MNRTAPLPHPPVEGLARHHAFLRARLRGLGVAEVNLDDAVQDVFEVLVRRMGDYDSRFSLRQWMAGVARKVARRHREHERRAPLAVDETRLPAATIDPEHAAARQEGLAVLRRFLTELDAERWAVFVLSEIEGLRGTEIAAELDVNLSTVYARLRTARQAFEVAAAAQRGPGRSWLGALLVGPTSLFRRPGTAAFTTPLALCALATAGLGLTFGARACAEPPTEVAPKVVRPAPAPTITPKFGTGIPGRPTDSARLLPASSSAPGGPPVADAEGWFGGGSGFSEGPGVWSTRLFYKLEGADLVVRVEYENEGEVLVHTAGWIDHDRLDGFEIVGSAADRPIEIAVEESQTIIWRLRATRAGVVRASVGSGRARDDGGGTHGFASVNEGGVLRACRKRECNRETDSAQARIPGARITVELRNDCGRALDVFEAPPAVDEPPPNASHHHLATGERRKVEIDSAMRLMLRDENGDFGGSIASDVPGAVFLFFGPDCGWSIVDAPAKPLE